MALVGTGYWARGRQATHVVRFTPWVPPLDHFLAWDSFSEIEQTRVLLHALCLQSISQIRSEYLAARSEPVVAADPDVASPILDLDGVISRLQALAREFEGSPEETLVQQELLRVLHRTDRHHAWLDVFLRVIYRDPTQPIISEFTERALHKGRLVGREDDVLSALRHRGEIPPQQWPAPSMMGSPECSPASGPVPRARPTGRDS